jgi:hypothetical protein
VCFYSELRLGSGADGFRLVGCGGPAAQKVECVLGRGAGLGGVDEQSQPGVGVVSRLGVSQYTEVPMGFDTMMRNITLTGGAAPARAYIEQLLPDILDGLVEPGKVFDRTVSLDEVPDGYRAMADRTALKVLIRP